MTPIRRALLAECVATATLVGIGVGAVNVAVATGSIGLGAIAATWGVAVVLLILIAGPASGAHANPAVTVAMASLGRLPWRLVPGYCVAQFVGAILAGAVLHLIFADSLAHAAICAGRPLSELIAAANVERWPHPGLLAGAPVAWWQAALAEAGGAGLIAATIVGATRPRMPAALAPAAIGASVAVAIVVFAPLSQAGFNPARDLGPRLIAACAGVTVPCDPAVLAVYVVAPVVGAIAGAHLASLLTPPEPA